MTPAVCAVAALAYLAAGLAGDAPAFAWGGFTIMILFGAGMVLAGRYSETAKALLDRRDERINALDRDATVITGVLLIVVILVMAVVETARGEGGSPYFELAGFAGLSYAVTFLWLRWRR
jgi:peptidoglycan/LPS O-acetylase OafA/YrhL